MIEWDDEEDADEDFPPSCDEWGEVISTIKDFEIGGDMEEVDEDIPEELPVIAERSHVPIIPDSYDHMDIQKRLSEKRDNDAKREMAKSVWAVRRDQVKVRRPSELIVKKEEVRQMSGQFPQVRGFTGPQMDGYGTVFYTDLTTGQNIGAEELMAAIQRHQMARQQVVQQQPQQLFDQYGRPVHIHGRMNDGRIYDQNGRQPQRGFDNFGTVNPHVPPSVDTTFVGGRVLSGPEAVAPTAQRQLRHGEYGFVKESLHSILGNKPSPLVHDRSTHAIVRMQNGDGEQFDLLLKRGKITMNKNDHVVPEIREGEGVVATIITRVENTPPSADSDVDMEASKLQYLASSLANIKIMATRFSKQSNGKAVLLQCGISTTVGEADSSVKAIADLVAASQTDKFIEVYHEVRPFLLEQYPSITDFIDRKIKKLVNDIMSRQLVLDAKMSGYYADDHADLKVYLEKQTEYEAFIEIFNEEIDLMFNLEVITFEMAESEEFDAISNTEKSFFIYGDVPELDKDLSEGVASKDLVPNLHAHLSEAAKLRVTNKMPGMYAYVANKEGRVVRTITARTKLYATALHYIV